MRAASLTLLGFILLTFSGCVYYEEFRQRKADADVREETAALMKQYRLCVQKYESEPAKAREYCEAYGQALHQLQLRPLEKR